MDVVVRLVSIFLAMTAGQGILSNFIITHEMVELVGEYVRHK